MRPDGDIDDIVAIASSDPAITAKLLQLANSSFFGVSRPVLDVDDAITLLGISTVRDLAAGSKLFESLATDLDPTYITQVESHSNQVARVASLICTEALVARETFSASILHDIGQLIIAVGFPDEARTIEDRVSVGESRCDVEMELFGVTHASIGAHLLRLWGLPTAVVEAVAWHHHGPQYQPWEMNAVHGTYLAELIVEQGPAIEDLVPDGYLSALQCDPAAYDPAVLEPPVTTP
jgi:putative nucleotidyltransferase with HDIG domain